MSNAHADNLPDWQMAANNARRRIVRILLAIGASSVILGVCLIGKAAYSAHHAASAIAESNVQLQSQDVARRIAGTSSPWSLGVMFTEFGIAVLLATAVAGWMVGRAEKRRRREAQES
jgi:hypothetical protein